MFIDIHTHKSDDTAFFVKNICIGLKNRLVRHISAGIHPWHISLIDNQIALKILVNTLKQPVVLLIGEAGLDKFAKTSPEKQLQIFEKQILIAENFNMPLIIHCVRCYDKLMQLRKKHKGIWIIHDFHGNMHIADYFINKNTYISLGRNFLRNHLKFKDLLKNTNFEHIFLETDTMQIPVSQVYEKARETANTDMQLIKNKVIKNFENVFGTDVLARTH